VKTKKPLKIYPASKFLKPLFGCLPPEKFDDFSFGYKKDLSVYVQEKILKDFLEETEKLFSKIMEFPYIKKIICQYGQEGEVSKERIEFTKALGITPKKEKYKKGKTC